MHALHEYVSSTYSIGEHGLVNFENLSNLNSRSSKPRHNTTTSSLQSSLLKSRQSVRYWNLGQHFSASKVPFYKAFGNPFPFQHNYKSIFWPIFCYRTYISHFRWDLCSGLYVCAFFCVPSPEASACFRFNASWPLHGIEFRFEFVLMVPFFAVKRKYLMARNLMESLQSDKWKCTWV
jgi:hypothetical protein